MKTVSVSRQKIEQKDPVYTAKLAANLNRLIKRGFDLVLAVMGLTLAAPLMALIWFLVWLDSPGKVIFAQKRLGREGKPFQLFKFRKFPSKIKDVGPGVTVTCDARMTRIGAFLARTKFDELPQLWNIVKGEMSFVGPRPESLRYAEMFKNRYAAVLNFLPGIFGPNQVAFRNEGELYPPDESPEAFYCRKLFPQKAEADLAYFSKANVFRDFIWIIRGIWVSLAGVVNWRSFMNAHARILAADLVLVWVGWLLATLIRFSGIPMGTSLAGFATGSWLLPPVVVGGMLMGGCYRHPVRYFSLQDGLRLGRTVPLAWMIGFMLLLGFSHRDLSLYLVPVGALILLPLLTAPRLWNRVRWEKRARVRQKHGHNVLIYGVADRGPALAGWVQTVSNLNLMGFLDDDAKYRGKLVSGYPVLGRESDIPTIHEVHGINEIWTSFVPDENKHSRLENVCDRLDIRLVIVPESELFSFERLMDFKAAAKNAKNLNELWQTIAREIENLDFDYAAFYLNALREGKEVDLMSTTGRCEQGLERRKTPLLLASVCQRSQEPNWTWTRQANQKKEDICSRRHLRLGLPLLNRDNKNIGNLVVLRDLEHNSLKAQNLQRLLHLQSVFTSVLSKTMNQQ